MRIGKFDRCQNHDEPCSIVPVSQWVSMSCPVASRGRGLAAAVRCCGHVAVLRAPMAPDQVEEFDSTLLHAHCKLIAQPCMSNACSQPCISDFTTVRITQPAHHLTRVSRHHGSPHCTLHCVLVQIQLLASRRPHVSSNLSAPLCNMRPIARTQVWLSWHHIGSVPRQRMLLQHRGTSALVQQEPAAMRVARSHVLGPRRLRQGQCDRAGLLPV
jgi:hypothetical protein